MITISEAFTGLYAAWRLFLRDTRAVALLDGTATGAIRSFYCALVVLPAYVLIVALAHPPITEEIGWFRFLLVEAIAYVVGWCAWPLLMYYVTQALDRTSGFFLYVAAFNWSAGPQIVIWLGVLVLAISGVVQREIVAVVNIAALIVIVVYHLFIVRVTLKLSFFVALALVIGEVMIRLFINQARESMLR